MARFSTLFFLFLQVFLFIPIISFAQDDAEGDRLEKNIYENIGTKESRQREINAYIEKAKSEKNRYHLYVGYALAGNNTFGELEKKYSDSLLEVAIKNKDNRLIAMAYQSSGISKVKNFNYNTALDHLLLSLEYFDLEESKERTYNSMLYIAETKAQNGDFAGAIKDINKVKDYFAWKIKQSDKIYFKSKYAATLLYLAKTYSLANQLPKSKKLLEEAEKQMKIHKEMASRQELFNLVNGIYNFQKKDYAAAVASLQKNIEINKDQNPHLTEKFYLAMSLWKLGKVESAEPYFAEIWGSYTNGGVLPWEFRPVFEFYSDYYGAKNQQDKVLQTAEMLTAYDKKAEAEKQKIAYRLATDYDEKQLQAEKKLEAESRNKERLITASVFGFLAACSGGAYLYRRRRKRKKMALLPAPQILPKNSGLQPNTEDEFLKYHPMHKDTVVQILGKLKIFEDENSFLKKNIRLADIAGDFRTNEKYLAKVIKISRDKGFHQYINDLRFLHYDEKCASEEGFKLKKVKEISDYLGFSSPEAFSVMLRERDLAVRIL